MVNRLIYRNGIHDWATLLCCAGWDRLNNRRIIMNSTSNSLYHHQNRSFVIFRHHRYQPRSFHQVTSQEITVSHRFTANSRHTNVTMSVVGIVGGSFAATPGRCHAVGHRQPRQSISHQVASPLSRFSVTCWELVYFVTRFGIAACQKMPYTAIAAHNTAQPQRRMFSHHQNKAPPKTRVHHPRGYILHSYWYYFCLQRLTG